MGRPSISLGFPPPFSTEFTVPDQAFDLISVGGGSAAVAALPGSEDGITSDGFCSLERRPKRVAIVGSGYVACELAGAFHELGAQVEIFIRKEHLLMSFDVMLGKSLMREMRDQGIIIHHHVVPAQVRGDSGLKTLTAVDGREFAGFDCVLWAVGRAANVAGLDLRPPCGAVDA